MQIYKLGEVPKELQNSVGGKARGLDKLIKEGFNVPGGFVIIDADERTNLDIVTKFYLDSGIKKVAVRSSASAEDGADFSFAGQFVTVLDVEGEQSFKDAVAKCIESLQGSTAKSYSQKFGGKKKITMNVVVQEMLSPSCAGVCFTCDPLNERNILVEAVKGMGEALVSGTASATQYRVAKDELENLGDVPPPLSKKNLRECCVQALLAQDVFKTPLDIEWATQGDDLYLLQARPITVNEVCDEDEFNPKQDLSGHGITRCNISEMLPGAVTPLSIFTSVYAIDWGIRKMMNVAGANKKMRELPDFACAFPAFGHLFINLSPMYALTKTMYLAKKEEVDMSICGRILGEEESGIVLGNKKWFGARVINSIKYINYIMSQKKVKKRLLKLADSFSILETNDPIKQYAAIDKSRSLANNVAYLHYATSGFSGAMSSSVIKILEKKYNNIEQSRGVLAQLLERIDGIESVDILASLYNLAQEIVIDNEAAKNYSKEELGQYLKHAGPNVKIAYNEFMKRHGHRAIREAELRNPGWSNDEAAFTGHLRTVLQSDMQLQKNQTEPDLGAIAKELGFGGKLVYFAKKARQGVRNREFSKSKLIKVFDVFKRAYTHLATVLVELGRLPDTDAIFFLTHDEIGELAKTENPSLVKKALQRRRILKSQEQLSFAEVYTNMPVPLKVQETGQAGDVLKGTSVSRGIVTGRARVVKSPEDAAKLEKGEIMVASFTDIGWSPYYCLIDGLVTEVGGALSHGAVVAREYALPLVTNIVGATKLIKTGDIITVDGGAGIVKKVLTDTK